MLTRSGIAVSPGVAIGQAMVFGAENFRIPQRFVSVDAVEAEVGRFQSALQTVTRALDENAVIVAQVTPFYE